jgi:hypothetical protein
MSTIAFDQFALTRIADFARSLSRLHQASRRQLVDDDAIDREFNAVCMSVWGYTTDDFSDELFSVEDHAFLDALDEAQARIFAAEQGYDLVDDQGMLTDWWGYCWMILAEKRGLLTPENRAACGDRGQISVSAKRDRRHRRAVSAGDSGVRGCEPGPILLCMGLFSIFCVWGLCGVPRKRICTASGMRGRRCFALAANR